MPWGIPPMMVAETRPDGLTARCPPGRCYLVDGHYSKKDHSPSSAAICRSSFRALRSIFQSTPTNMARARTISATTCDACRVALTSVYPSCGCEFAFGSKTTEPA